MNIEELEDNHYKISDEFNRCEQQHTKLSIQFAIEVLKSMLIDVNDLYADEFDYFFNDKINNKIQELKQYLDGNN
jgi:hypothetical protein